MGQGWVPFVGRTAECAALAGLVAAARAGRGGLALVGGPAGIGKTRLVDEIVTGLPTGRGGVPPGGAGPALWPWTRAVGALRRAGPPLAGWAGDVLDRLDAAVTVPASGRLAALADVADRLGAPPAPAAAVLEDLHWADAASLDLLALVAEGVPDGGLLVVGTHRPAADPARDVSQLARFPGVVTVRLGPLTSADVVAFAHRLGPGVAVVDPVTAHGRSGGLPLLLPAALAGAGGPDGGLDAAVATARLLAQLDDADRALLEVAALVGPEIDPGLVAQIADVPGPDVVRALDAARRAGLVSGPEDAGFVHELVREATAAGVAGERAVTLHRRAAAALGPRAQAGEPGVAAMVAAHWDRAGTDPDALAATREWAGRAADEATAGHDHATAAVLRASAVRAAERLGDPPDRVAEGHLLLAGAHCLAGRVDVALDACEQAARLGRRAGRPDLVARAALVVTWVTNPDTVTRVTALARAALEDGGVRDPATRARVLAQRATQSGYLGAVAEAAEDAAEAVRLAEECGDPQARLDAARAREMNLVEASDAQERLLLGDLAVATGEALDEPRGVLLGHTWRLRSAYQLGRLELAREAFGGIVRVAERTRLPVARWHHHRAAAAVAVLEGRFDEGREHSLAAQNHAGADVAQQMMRYPHAERLAVLRGDPSELPTDYAAVFAAVPSMPLVTVGRVAVLILLGAEDEARALWATVPPLLRAPVVDVRWGGVLHNAVDAVEHFADAGTAAVIAEQLRPYATYPGVFGVPTVYFSGAMSRDLGRALVVAGRSDEAEPLLRRAVRDNEACAARPFAVLSRLDLAGVLVRRDGDRGARAEAAGLIAEALAEARRLDMPGAVTRAGRLAAALTDADPLTRREREVADLVTLALSNREIADRLVLSERTVESHVRSVLAKLGHPNRTALIASRRPAAP